MSQKKQEAENSRRGFPTLFNHPSRTPAVFRGNIPRSSSREALIRVEGTQETAHFQTADPKPPKDHLQLVLFSASLMQNTLRRPQGISLLMLCPREMGKKHVPSTKPSKGTSHIFLSLEQMEGCHPSLCFADFVQNGMALDLLQRLRGWSPRAFPKTAGSQTQGLKTKARGSIRFWLFSFGEEEAKWAIQLRCWDKKASLFGPSTKTKRNKGSKPPGNRVSIQSARK